MIYIANKKTKESTLQKKYPNALILDVSSKGEQPWVKFSPFYPHGNIPIPPYNNEIPKYFSQTIEGIWQGLKVFDGEDIDSSKFEIKNMKGIKRTVRKFGKPVGHRNGVDGENLLDYRTARKEIYLRTYAWVLDNLLQNEILLLKEKAEKQDIILLDYNTNEDTENYTKPLSHAGLVKRYLLRKHPDLAILKSFEPKTDEKENIKSKRKKNELPINNLLFDEAQLKTMKTKREEIKDKIKSMSGCEREEHWRNQTLVNRTNSNSDIKRQYYALVIFIKDAINESKERFEPYQNPLLHLVSHCMELSYKSLIKSAIDNKIINLEYTKICHEHSLEKLLATVADVVKKLEKEIPECDIQKPLKNHSRLASILKTNVTTYRYANIVNKKGEYKGKGHPFEDDYESPNMLDVFSLFEYCVSSITDFECSIENNKIV